jgi:kumamolisin
MSRHVIPGSHRSAPDDATCVGDADPAQRISAVIRLRRQNSAALDETVDRLMAGEAQAPMSREAFAEQYGAAPEDIAKVRQFAQSHGLTVEREEPGSGSVTLGGTVSQFNATFGVALQSFQRHNAAAFIGRTGAVHVPDALNGVVTSVLGLDSRPQARPHFRMRPPMQPARDARVASFSPTQLATLYDFPASTGAGQCVAIVELGGGYRDEDLDAYFARLGVSRPEVVAVPVGGGANAPTGDASGPDGEVLLDIEIVGAIVPEATIAAYFAPNSDAGFIEAVSAAIHDTVRRPSVVSISWGGPEPRWTRQSANAFNDVLKAAMAVGVTVCVASGDNGSSDGVGDSAGHVDFPASSPYVLACGGTSLQAQQATISREIVWNNGAQGGATGGGVSALFAAPAWQRSLSAQRTGGTRQTLTHRGMPDVAGDADPATGYEVRVDGVDTVVGGTSAVAPLWAGLIARINALKGAPAGYVNARLYAAAQACRDITEGNNGDYAAARGWDACTGLGSPRGGAVLDALQGGPSAQARTAPA